jgi:hypothetical protein
MACRRRLEQVCGRGTSREEGSWAGKGAARFSFVRRGFGVIDCDWLYWKIDLECGQYLGQLSLEIPDIAGRTRSMTMKRY